MQRPIPRPEENENTDGIVRIVNDIVDLEHAYLTAVEEVLDSGTAEPEERAEVENLRCQHNEKAGKLVGKLDEAFFSFYDVTAEERSLMEDVVRAGNMPVF